MNLIVKMPPRQREIAEGVFQSSLSFDPNTLSIEDFTAEGLVLPPNLQSAIKKRQIEFLVGRLCARHCFAHFGVNESPHIASHDDRSPLWPLGWVGSISHTQGLATAVLARATSVRGIGVDIEGVIEKANPQLAQHICIDTEEWTRLQSTLGLPEDLALTLIFSGKECLYKAVYPRLGAFFGFHAAEIRPKTENRLSVQLLTDLSDDFSRGREWELSYRILENNCVETLLIDS